MSASFTPDPADPRRLRDAFGRFATGVTLVTTATPEGPAAIAANSFASLSLDPPLVLWAPQRAARRFRHFAEAGHFSIHVLAAHQHDLCRAVAADAFALASLGLAATPEGMPLIEDCLARFDCARAAAHDGGDHLLILGRVLRVTLGQGDPLAFWAGRMHSLAAP